MKRNVITILALAMVFSFSPSAVFGEPTISSYEAAPQFLEETVNPGVMIMLDNSGSMNYNAYGDPTDDGDRVDNDVFEGEPYNTSILSVPLVDEENDAFELSAVSDTPNLADDRLVLGQLGADNTVAGVRFENVALPPDASIKEAYIAFTAHGDSPGSSSLTLWAEDTATSSWFSSADGDIAGRAITTESVSWTGVDAWVDGETYETPDIAPLIREVIQLNGWASGNSLSFLIRGSGTRTARTFDYPSGGGIHAPKLVIILNAKEPRKYYGYFNSDYFYTYDVAPITEETTDADGNTVTVVIGDNSRFIHKYRKIRYSGDHTGTSGGKWLVKDIATNAETTLSDSDINNDNLWDGNWLNWLTMRRIDVLRKVLVGGKVKDRDTSGEQVNLGEVPVNESRWHYVKRFDTTVGAEVSPYTDITFYQVRSGNIYVAKNSNPYDNPDATLRIAIEKKKALDPQDFHEWNNGDYLAGVLQKVYYQARWGNSYFRSSGAGGEIRNVLGTDLNTLVGALDSEGCNSNTPLAETYSIVLQHFRQAEEAGDPYDAQYKEIGEDKDPYKINGLDVSCAKNFIIVLTDGKPTSDCNLAPSWDQDLDGDSDTNSSNGCTLLDDLAYYAYTNDQRTDLAGNQTIETYTIFAFGADAAGEQLLRDTASNGSGGKDENNDGEPDNYFNTDDGYELEAALQEAFADIASRTASSTSASVLTANYSGEGNVLQAYFKSELKVDDEKAKWVGFMHSLWIDEYGFMREDNGDKALDVTQDRVVKFVLSGGNTVVNRYAVDADTPYPDTSSCSTGCEQIEMGDLNPLFEAGELLANTSPNDRRIWTYIDTDQNDEVGAGEFITFDAANVDAIKPYLGVKTDANWKYLGSTHAGRARHLIEYIRGYDQGDMPCTQTNACDSDTAMRKRTIQNVTYKLGDIINSSPVVVGAPVDYYHLIYKDESYQEYFDNNRNREKVVYVGANDGMLHAFTSWQYDVDAKRFNRPNGTNEDMGEEIWAYIPQSLLPHLKWLPQEKYPHTYYVDMTPKVFDAKIVPTGAENEYGWGTFLLCGLNMGGKEITVLDTFGTEEETRTFKPSYFLLDITNPRSPKLMWERSYENLGMSASFPAVVKVGDKWFAAFGSGPTTYKGTSAQSAYIYLVDLKTGIPYRKDGINDWMWGPLDDKGFMNGPLPFDKNLNYNVDAVYFGSASETTNADGDTVWKGNLYKITVPCADNGNCPWAADYKDNQLADYDPDPANWKLHTLFEADGPITARLTASVDFELLDNVWVYFGTGRFYNEDDKTDTNQQYLYGIKDPFFSKKYEGTSPEYYHNYTASKTVLTNELFDTDGFEVTEAESILKNNALFADTARDTWREFLPWVRSTYDGWRLSLSVPEITATDGTTSLGPAERCVSKPGLIGGTLLIPTFTPHEDACKFGGNTDLYGLYFETGTGYIKQAFNLTSKRTFTGVDGEENIVEHKLPDTQIGPPPPGIGLHAGREKGAKAFMQQGTGEVVDLNIDPALNFKSGITRFREDLSID